MEDDLITTKEVGDYRIKVYYCRDSECPITNWGLFGSFFFEYSDMHRLHDECNWKTFFYDNKHNLRDVIDAIVMKHIEQKDIVKYLKKGEANGISFTYNRGSNVWELKHKTSPYIDQEFSPSDLTDFDCRGELIEDLDDEDLLDIIYILKMVGYFRGSEKEGQVFCDMITERIEKYEKRMSYDKGKLNN